MKDIKLVCFDMDDTLISQNSWYKLNLALGVTPEEDKEMYDAYTRGELSYVDWTTKLISLYKERRLATKSNISKILSEYSFKKGAVELVSNLQQKGYELVIISGSFDLLIRDVADTLKVTNFKANTYFKFNDENYLEELISGGDELHAKVQHLKGFCDDLGVSLDECVCIGDGANDIELFKTTRKGITFNDAPQNIKEAAWKVVESLSDVNELL